MTNCFRESYFGIYFLSFKATREINTKITLNWAQKQFITRVHTLLYFLHDIMNPSVKIKTMIFTHCPHVSFAQFLFYWWRHNQLWMTSQWPDNCDLIMWIVIYNSIDINFILLHIQGWSCRKINYFVVTCCILCCLKHPSYLTQYCYHKISYNRVIFNHLWYISIDKYFIIVYKLTVL